MGIARMKWKIGPEQLERLKADLRAGHRQMDIAVRYGVTRGYVCKVAKKIGERYRSRHTKKVRFAQHAAEVEAALRAGERHCVIARRIGFPRWFVSRYASQIGQSYVLNYTKKARAYQSEVRA
jgi:hypothetical protein